MDGAFDWGGDKGGKLPRHIERMSETTRPAEMKSGSGSNLPWGGDSKEKAKAYATGLPKNKGSMMSKTGATKKPTSKPQNDGKALQGMTLQPKSKAVSMPKAKKAK